MIFEGGHNPVIFTFRESNERRNQNAAWQTLVKSWIDHKVEVEVEAYLAREYKMAMVTYCHTWFASYSAVMSTYFVS